MNVIYDPLLKKVRQQDEGVGPAGPAGAGYGGTSTTSLAIGTGSKVFTTQAGLAYKNGARVRASSAANAANFMEGVVTYSGTTLTMTCDLVGGSGTKTDWNLNLAGEPGSATITGGASTIATANLTAARVLISDVNGKVTVSEMESLSLLALQPKTRTQITATNGQTLTQADSGKTVLVGDNITVHIPANSPTGWNVLFIATGTPTSSIVDGNAADSFIDTSGSIIAANTGLLAQNKGAQLYVESDGANKLYSTNSIKIGAFDGGILGTIPIPVQGWAAAS